MNLIAILNYVIAATILYSPYHPPEGQVLWSNGPGYPPTLVPYEFALEAVNIVQCESTGNVNIPNESTGARGRFQIHPIHDKEMISLGLSPQYEPDRVRYSVVLWRRNGWSDWSCKP